MATTTNDTSDGLEECDVLVVGSGAGGLAAALTASVLGLDVVICEQDRVLGGASAISGGELWIPMSHQAGNETGDSDANALAYLEHVIGPRIDRKRAEAYVRNASPALAFIEDHSPVQYELLSHVVDYFSDLPGATVGQRTLGAIPFDGRRLGRWFPNIRSPLAIGTIFGGMSIGREDLPHLMNCTRSVASALHVFRMLLHHASDRLRGYSRGTRMVMGNALVGGLVHALREREVPLWLNSSVKELTVTHGRVTGAVVRREGRSVEIRCRRAIILATGSFSGSAAKRTEYFPHVQAGKPHYSHVPSSSDGSGLAIATACGAVIEESNGEPGAWTPVSLLKDRTGATTAFPHFGDRARPGVIVVNAAGGRFVNEAINYHDFVQALIAHTSEHPRAECFIVTSHAHLRRYGLGRVPAFPGRIHRFIRNGYLRRGRDLASLAQQIGIEPTALERTVAEFDHHARQGDDPVFHKGETEFERAAGDATQRPNPCVAPLGPGPYYAIRMIPGDIGSMRGLRVDGDARVMNASGAPIQGLYAVGTVATSVTAGTYPGAGTMLGPSITFGFLAARHIAGVLAPESVATGSAQSA